MPRSPVALGAAGAASELSGRAPSGARPPVVHNLAAAVLGARAGCKAGAAQRTSSTWTGRMPASAPASGGLLARLDALVGLVASRRGLVLAPDGTLARSEARAVAKAAGLPARSAAGEVALLVALALAVGLVRVRAQRVEVSALRPAAAAIAANATARPRLRSRAASAARPLATNTTQTR